MGEPYLGGTLPVLATPFTRSDAVDLPSLRRIADYAVAAGADGVVYPGVASEVDTLSREERAGAFRCGLRGRRRQGAGDLRCQRARCRGGGEARAGRRGRRRGRGNGHGTRRGQEAMPAA